jgi:hypothetical protein
LTVSSSVLNISDIHPLFITLFMFPLKIQRLIEPIKSHPKESMILESIVIENIKSLSKESIVFEKDNCPSFL